MSDDLGERRTDFCFARAIFSFAYLHTFLELVKTIAIGGEGDREEREQEKLSQNHVVDVVRRYYRVA